MAGEREPVPACARTPLLLPLPSTLALRPPVHPRVPPPLHPLHPPPPHRPPRPPARPPTPPPTNRPPPHTPQDQMQTVLQWAIQGGVTRDDAARAWLVLEDLVGRERKEVTREVAGECALLRGPTALVLGSFERCPAPSPPLCTPAPAPPPPTHTPAPPRARSLLLGAVPVRAAPLHRGRGSLALHQLLHGSAERGVSAECVGGWGGGGEVWGG